MTLRYSLLVISLMFSVQLFSQETNTAEDSMFVDSMNNYIVDYLEMNDIGFIWSGENSRENRLGFIGPEYQRMTMEYNSIIQNFDNPYEYFFFGQTTVDASRCVFQGSLLITETGYIPDPEHPELVRGFIAGNYVFFEDQSCLHAGVFRGEFISSFYIDETNTLYYDDLKEDDPDFTNNEFFGVWEDYQGEVSYTCNWGDHRIPFSGELDIGLNEFSPSFKFIDNGWREYLEENE